MKEHLEFLNIKKNAVLLTQTAVHDDDCSD